MRAPRLCGACGAVVPPDDHFCAAWGTPLTHAPPRPPMTSAPANEQTIFQNELGRITDRRVIFERGSGRGSHARREVPLRSIASVHVAAHRHPFVALLFAVLGATAPVRTPNAGGVIIAVMLLGLALSLFMGRRTISLALIDGTKHRLRVRLMQAKGAQPFIAALRHQLFKTTPNDGQQPSSQRE